MKTKKWLIVLLSVLMCVSAVVGIACNKEKDPEWISSNWEVMPENTNENLKYFGYFHCDGFLSQGSYMEEIASLEGTNIFMINSQFNDELVLEKFALAKQLNHKVILSIHGLFSGGKISVANSATLASNWEDILTNKMDVYKPYIEDGTILSFYFDEPAWNGIKQEDFRKVTKWLRENCPNTKVMNCMTVYDVGISQKANYPEIDPAYNEYCTDVMYDNYSKWNDVTRRDYLEKLKSKALQDQYIWGCATGFVNNPEQNGELYNAIKGMYTEAIQEPRYAGIISFSYADGLEGDWGYGMHSFLNEDSDYYDRDLKHLYVQIGREVIGLDAKDFSKEVDLQVNNINEVYEIGEEVILPAVGATDSNGNDVEVTWKITSPSGVELPAEVFVAEESGLYTVEVCAGEGEFKRTKTAYIAVRYENEISNFDTEAYTQDAGGTKDDTWCWARQVVNTFSRTGLGSLKVTPHATDGIWPRIVFNHNLNQVWDLSNAGYVSMWVYNDSDTTISGFALVISNEDISPDFSYHTSVDLAPRTWTEVKSDIAMVRAAKPDLDLTKATIFYGNCASDYQNRATFYIDDVAIIPSDGTQEQPGYSMEYSKDIGMFRPMDPDLYSVGMTENLNFVKEGQKAIKLSAVQRWPRYYFTQVFIDWLIEENIQSFTFEMYIDNESSQTDCTQTEGIILSSEPITDEWVTVTVNVSELTTESHIQFNKDDTFNLDVYLDNIQYTYGEETPDNPEQPDEPEVPDVPEIPDTPEVPEEPVEGATVIAFENQSDIELIGTNADDVWTWPYEISTERAYRGNSSLKINVRQDGGSWPNVVFGNANGITWDLTNVENISLWVYIDGDGFDTFGFKICNMVADGDRIVESGARVEKTYSIAGATWTKITITASDILGKAIDYTTAYVKFSQLGGTYSNKANFYIDDVQVVFGEKQDEPTGFANAEGNYDLNMFTPDLDIYQISLNTDTAYVKDGTSSIKFRAEAQWPRYKFTQEYITWLNEQGYTQISFDLYIDAANSNTTVSRTEGVKWQEGMPMNEWYTVTISVSDLTKESFIQFNKPEGGFLDVYFDNVVYVK